MENRTLSALDHPNTTIKRKDFIEKKPFMRQIYTEWYHLIKQQLPDHSTRLIELGTGPGFMNHEIPAVISSDLLYLPYIDILMDGRQLPFKSYSIDGILMVDVFHHISNVEDLFSEADRILRTGGRVIMVEPWMTAWSKWVYTRFHHESMDTTIADWAFKPSGPLSGANQALPWIVFKRDRKRFEQKFPYIRIVNIDPIMPTTYIFGGGFSMLASFPGFLYPVVRKLEKMLLRPDKTGMFALIVLEKIK